MRFLIDTNIVLDVLLKRDPFYDSGAKILKLSKYDDINLYVSASAITDIYYIANRAVRDKEEIKKLLKKLLQVVSIASVSEAEIRNALTLPWRDFEDSVQYSVALLQEMDGIVTCNPDDYKKAEIAVLQPEELLEQWGISGDFFK